MSFAKSDPSEKTDKSTIIVRGFTIPVLTVNRITG